MLLSMVTLICLVPADVLATTLPAKCFQVFGGQLGVAPLTAAIAAAVHCNTPFSPLPSVALLPVLSIRLVAICAASTQPHVSAC
jgi:hypothetical protein